MGINLDQSSALIGGSRPSPFRMVRPRGSSPVQRWGANAHLLSTPDAKETHLQMNDIACIRIYIYMCVCVCVSHVSSTWFFQRKVVHLQQVMWLWVMANLGLQTPANLNRGPKGFTV